MTRIKRQSAKSPTIMLITPKPAPCELFGAGVCVVVLFDADSICEIVEIGGNCEAAVIDVESVVGKNIKRGRVTSTSSVSYGPGPEVTS
jgi:hypothetical protein